MLSCGVAEIQEYTARTMQLHGLTVSANLGVGLSWTSRLQTCHDWCSYWVAVCLTAQNEAKTELEAHCWLVQWLGARTELCCSIGVRVQLFVHVGICWEGWVTLKLSIQARPWQLQDSAYLILGAQGLLGVQWQQLRRSQHGG